MADPAEIRALIAEAEGRADALVALAQTYRNRLEAIDARRHLAELQEKRAYTDALAAAERIAAIRAYAAKEIASASMRIQNMYGATQAAVVNSAGFNPPSDPAEPEPAVHTPKPRTPTGGISHGALMLDIDWYGFHDAAGHPLRNCAEFVELARRAEIAVNLALAVTEPAVS